jgi:hypothetical protein
MSATDLSFMNAIILSGATFGNLLLSFWSKVNSNAYIRVSCGFCSRSCEPRAVVAFSTSILGNLHWLDKYLVH